MKNRDGAGDSEPSSQLAGKILLRIQVAERRELMTKAFAFGVVLLSSLSLIVYGVMDVMAEAARSGFSAFASLLFSDFGATIASFSDYLLSLVESFPIFSVVLLLSGIFFAIWSAGRFIEEVALIRRHPFSA